MLTEYNMRTHPYVQGTTNTNTVNLGLTTRCTMKCPSCTIAIPRFKEQGVARDMTAMEFLRAGQFMRGKLRRLHFTGGEPMLHPSFGPFAMRAKSLFNVPILTLETNGTMYRKNAYLVKTFFDLVFITHYIKDAIYPGSPDNTQIIEEAQAYLGDKLVIEPPVTHMPAHRTLQLGRSWDDDVKTIPDMLTCSKWHDPGLPSGYYNGLIFPCCVSVGINPSLGIPLTANWQEEIRNAHKGCSDCCYAGT